ncbi:MAG: tetratricopeptide repeat protein [Kofleriaceae bacterium]|nr:tetratricopeptide repeat protein [Myxococcales bacterium]MCB9562220.1 tetratricopeptide repeat protein [Kofleriaceae bacterium]
MSAPPTEVSGTQIERETRFSESVVWALQRQYYGGRGPAAWHSGEVPSYATCNTFIAKSYAEAVLVYLTDARAAGQIDPAHPVYIVELAAGVGRFAFQFLCKWRQLFQESAIADLDVRYVMTDFVDHNPRVWAAHPHLAPFVATGTLCFGVFDVETAKEIELLDGAGVLSAATVHNPMVVLGNYAFDTFTMDLFKFGGGEAREVRISVRAPAGVNPAAPRLPELLFRYTDHPIEGTYYEDPALERTLAAYRETLSGTMISIPIGGLRGLRTLLEMSRNRLLLLTSDKGFIQHDELYHRQQHAMQFHGDGFSMMVNFHAIASYLAECGGWSMGTARRTLNLRTLAGVVGGDGPAFGSTRVHLRELMEFGPGEFFELYQTTRRGPPQTLPQFLGLLRLSGYDPQMLCEFAGTLRELVTGLDEIAQFDVRVALDRAWRNYYPGPVNMPFELARIYMVMKRPVEAARFYQISLDWFGETPATRFNLGICYYYAERPADALVEFRRALELAPDFQGAHEWISRLKAEAELGLGGPERHVAPTSRAPVVTLATNPEGIEAGGAKTAAAEGKSAARVA